MLKHFAALTKDIKDKQKMYRLEDMVKYDDLEANKNNSSGSNHYYSGSDHQEESKVAPV